MTRSITAGMASHLAGDGGNHISLDLSIVLQLDLIDGSTIAITDHDRPLQMDLGAGVQTFVPYTGMRPTNLVLAAGFGPDEFQVRGPLVPEATQAWHVTKAMVVGKRLHSATARFAFARWSDLADGHIPLMRGFVAKVEVDGDEFECTIRSEISRFEQEVGRMITAFCDADFGDARCGFVETPEDMTVTGVTDELRITLNNPNTRGDDYFKLGKVNFTTGALAGIRPIEIFAWSSTGDTTLFIPLPDLPEIGDQLEVSRGCARNRPACMAYGNILNFRGFPDVPGTSQVLRYPNPGS